MKRVFLDKYFPATRLNAVKKSISNIEQHASETLYDYHERYNRLVASCPYHGYAEQDLILYFYNGLIDEERRLVNAACSGNILNKTPTEAIELFTELAEGSRQYRRSSGKQAVVMPPSQESSLQTEVSELKELVKKCLISGGKQHVRACGVCEDTSHTSEACPILQEPTADVNAVGGFGPPRPRYDPYSNMYNSG